MKKTITKTLLLLFLINLSSNAQTQVADFETFTLSVNSFYKDTNSVPFQTTNAVFGYNWDTQFDYWSGGFSYTNVHDSVTAGFANIYGCRPKFGYNNSDKYATAQNKAVIKIKAPYDHVDGFYITNSNYAYKSMKNGDAFAKKFGGSSGNDPDYFKITAKGFLNGAMKNDSAVFYLADYRFTNNALDYLVNEWQWFNTSSLGQVDSIQFFMYSSDNGSFGMNTPAFFCIDNFTTTDNVVGLDEQNTLLHISVYPNPFHDKIIFTGVKEICGLKITDMTGKIVYKELISMNQEIQLSFLEKGIYIAEVRTNHSTGIQKLIKH